MFLVLPVCLCSSASRRMPQYVSPHMFSKFYQHHSADLNQLLYMGNCLESLNETGATVAATAEQCRDNPCMMNLQILTKTVASGRRKQSVTWDILASELQTDRASKGFLKPRHEVCQFSYMYLLLMCIGYVQCISFLC